MRKILREDKEFPEKLKIAKPKVKKIFIEGNIKNLNEFGIAIVGSRNCSPEGEKITKEFTSKLTNCGINIISGLAKGIDSIAHRICIENGGKTIAVLGSGLNNIFPEENYKLYKEILETGGTVITEYEPEIQPIPLNFPQRNRIISSLSDGILVIEGKYRSGTTITGHYGLNQGKKVFCIPHSLSNPYGTGPNSLIKEGANLITTATDILETYGKNYENYENKYTNEILQLLSEEILTKEEIAQKLEKSISEINKEITILELEGKISKYAGKGYRIIE